MTEEPKGTARQAAPAEAQGLVRAFELDCEGGARTCSWAEIRRWTPAQGTIWVHLDAREEAAACWLRDESGLDERACDALLEESSRPRSTAIDDGLVVILRGVNLNPGSDPEDMAALRVWIDARRVISSRRRRVLAAESVAGKLAAGDGPRDAADVLVQLAEHLLDRMSPVLDELEDQVDELEERAYDGAPSELQERLADLRGRVISLRRHLAPQRDAMSRLAATPAPFFDDDQKTHLRELTHQVTRYVEGLDELRERLVVTGDLLTSRQTETMNQRMLLLSLVASVSLPLSLLTGLLGINVGGIPGTESRWAFLIVCAVLAAVAAGQIAILRKRGWF